MVVCPIHQGWSLFPSSCTLCISSATWKPFSIGPSVLTVHTAEGYVIANGLKDSQNSKQTWLCMGKNILLSCKN